MPWKSTQYQFLSDLPPTLPTENWYISWTQKPNNIKVSFSCRLCLKRAKEDDGVLSAYPYLFNNLDSHTFPSPETHVHTFMQYTFMYMPHMHTKTVLPTEWLQVRKGRSVSVAQASPRSQVFPCYHSHLTTTHTACCNSESRKKILAKEEEAVALKQWKNHPNRNIC